MSSGLRNIDSSLAKTHEWLKDTMELLETDDKEEAYLALRAVFHALRDRLPLEEAIQFASQLPLVLKGVYFDGWSGKMTKMSREEFLECVHSHFMKNPEVDPEALVRVVLAVATKRTTLGEIEDVLNALPKDFTDFFPPPPVGVA